MHATKWCAAGAAVLALSFTVTIPPPTARADCNSAGGATVCSQGEVRGPDGVPRVATPVIPYPCDYDWYCGSDWDFGIDWNPGRPGIGGPGGPGGPGRPGRP
jgi:hypothetical protein